MIVLGLMVLASGTISTYVTQYMTTYAQNTLHMRARWRSPRRWSATALDRRRAARRLAGGSLGRKPVMIWPQLVDAAR